MRLSYLLSVRRPTLLLALTACSGGSAKPASVQDITYHTQLAADEEPPPPYGKAELGKALIAERAAEARNEREVTDAEAGDPDALRVAVANLAVRRRFIHVLELCEANARMCPPRLDEPAWHYAVDADTDPKLDVPLRFDLDSWKKVAAELHGRACGCRTLDCIDSMETAIARLEVRPMPDVQADDDATAEVTRARECLMRLRGLTRLPKIVTD
jgi:hypothetical protein